MESGVVPISRLFKKTWASGGLDSTSSEPLPLAPGAAARFNVTASEELARPSVS
jgi:hypothetical protein